VSELPAWRVVLLRNEESDWNARKLFTGWVNVGLTTTGEQQASQSPAFLCCTALHPT
jgi:2,3-bisphosphoglycerate-dependent phosphoglycerate mutase